MSSARPARKVSRPPISSSLRTTSLQPQEAIHGERRRRTRGFTLLEAMVAIVLLGGGIVAATSAFASLSRVEDTARQSERMQRLAQAKLAELTALGTATTSANGDFSDQGEPNITWSLEVNTSGITDLDQVSISVQSTDGGARGPRARLDTLIFVPETTTTTSSGTTGGTTG